MFTSVTSNLSNPLNESLSQQSPTRFQSWIQRDCRCPRERLSHCRDRLRSSFGKTRSVSERYRTVLGMTLEEYTCGSDRRRGKLVTLLPPYSSHSLNNQRSQVSTSTLSDPSFGRPYRGFKCDSWDFGYQKSFLRDLTIVAVRESEHSLRPKVRAGHFSLQGPLLPRWTNSGRKTLRLWTRSLQRNGKVWRVTVSEVHCPLTSTIGEKI